MTSFSAAPRSISFIIILVGSIFLIASLLVSYSPSNSSLNFDGNFRGISNLDANNFSKNSSLDAKQAIVIIKDYDLNSTLAIAPTLSIDQVPKNLAFSPELSPNSIIAFAPALSTDESNEVDNANDSISFDGVDSKEPDVLFSSVFVDDNLKNGSEIGNDGLGSTNQAKIVEYISPPPVKDAASVKNIALVEDPANDYDKSTMRNCDLYHGKWIYDPSGPIYTNSTCPILTRSQNCQGNGRPDKNYENWRWKPDQCELPRFNGRKFLELLRGKTLAFVGDSLARNQMESLLCMLWQTEAPISHSNRQMHKWYFQSTTTTIIRIWSAWLVKKTDLPFSSPSPRAVKVHLDIPDNSFTEFLPNFDVLVLSSGHWFTKESTYLINNTAIPRRQLRRRRKRKKSPKKNQLNNVDFYGLALQTILNALASFHDYKGLTILRSYSPEHYVGGAWNTGGSCLGINTVSSKPEKSMHTTVMKNKQFEEFQRAVKARNGFKLRYMDVTDMSAYRHDGHPSVYSSQMRNKARIKPEDCTHWCMPGPVDTWNEILFEILKREL